jgi:hypothetical protein
MDQLFSWQGASGRWYAHTVLALVNPGWTCAANYAFVRRDVGGKYSSLYFGETDDLSRRWGEHSGSGLIRDALRMGGNELHVHLLAETKHGRLDVETDLRNGHATALNQQPSAARNALASLLVPPVQPLDGLFGLGLRPTALSDALAGLAAAPPDSGHRNALASLLSSPLFAPPYDPLKGLK